MFRYFTFVSVFSIYFHLFHFRSLQRFSVVIYSLKILSFQQWSLDSHVYNEIRDGRVWANLKYRQTKRVDNKKRGVGEWTKVVFAFRSSCALWCTYDSQLCSLSWHVASQSCGPLQTTVPLSVMEWPWWPSFFLELDAFTTKRYRECRATR